MFPWPDAIFWRLLGDGLFGFAAKWKKLKPARLKRLADSIDALVEKDNRAIDQTRGIEAKRCIAAVELHQIFRHFVESVNALATKASLVLDPDEFEESMFLDSDQEFLSDSRPGKNPARDVRTAVRECLH